MALQLSGDIAGLGKIVQIVRATDTTDRSIASSTWTDVPGMSVTITPTKSDSSILLIANFGYVRTLHTSGTNTFIAGDLRITDSSNNLISGLEYLRNAGADIRQLGQSMTGYGFVTPGSSSPQTYKAQFRSNASTVSFTLYNSESTGQLFAIEVAA